MIRASRESLGFLDQIAREPRVRVLRSPGEFNFGRLNNFASTHRSDSEFVALLNNDLTVITPDWLGEMVSQALQPGSAQSARGCFIRTIAFNMPA